MTKQEVMNYVTETPHNVNRNILGQKLDEFQKNVSWNDLKDKPFYREVETFTLAENYPVENKENGGACSAEAVVDKQFVPGDKVNVTVYGKQYECIAYDDDGDYTVSAVDNAYTSNDGRVFSIVSSAGRLMFWLEQGASTVTITVTRETVHKLDAKYLPGVVTLVVKAVFPDSADAPTCELIEGTYEAAVNALTNGKGVICHLLKMYNGYQRCLPVEIVNGGRLSFSHGMFDYTINQDNSVFAEED